MTTTISTRLDANRKREAEELFSSLGLSLSSAINLFIVKSLDYGGIPFEIRREPRRTELDEAVAEARRIVSDPATKRYTDVDQLFADALA